MVKLSKPYKSRKEYYKSLYDTSWPRRFALMIGRVKTNLKTRSGGAKILQITASDIQAQFDAQNGRDFYTGLPLVLSTHRDPKINPSLERYNNAKGYEPGNILLTVNAVNVAKGSMSMDDFVGMCRLIAGKWPSKGHESFWAVAESTGVVPTCTNDEPLPEPAEPAVSEPLQEEAPKGNWMSNLMQKQLEELNIKPLTGLRDLSWQERDVK